ncbi:MAG: 5-(carboxyamino)imidazole ribonucleotide synthase [Mycobacteriales bacterium]
MPHPVTGLPVVGMVGAGQLARMTHEAALPLGLSLQVMARHPDDSAALATPFVTLGAPDDARRLAAFAATCDVVTFDHELVPASLVDALAGSGTKIYPGAIALATTQDKVRMRRNMADLGLPVPAWAEVHDEADLTRFAADHGWPVVLKRARGGYDGRGVFFLAEAGPLPVPVDEGLLVEEQVSIERELAVVLARRPSGQIAAHPVVETVQRSGICVEVIAPAPALSRRTAEQALEIARTVAEGLDVVGVLAVELFDSGGSLTVNELAVRPHNSGHWTIDGARTSQFSQHLRAVLDWPLGDPGAAAPWTVMANVLAGPGTDAPSQLAVALADRGVRVHLYAKSPRPGRKVGHVTVTGTDLPDVRTRAARAARVLSGESS